MSKENGILYWDVACSQSELRWQENFAISALLQKIRYSFSKIHFQISLAIILCYHSFKKNKANFNFNAFFKKTKASLSCTLSFDRYIQLCLQKYNKFVQIHVRVMEEECKN